MFLIERLSRSLAHGISSSLGMDNDREEIIAYGAFALLQTLWSVILVIVFGIFFNVFVESLVISISISALRKYSGGAHSSSPNRCALIGAIASTLLAKLAILATSFLSFYIVMFLGVLSFGISYFVIYKLAPVDSKSKPIKKAETRKRLKKNSFRIVHISLMVTMALSAVYYIYDVKKMALFMFCICIGILWQSFSLSGIGHLVLGTIDNLFRDTYLLIRGEKNE